MKNRKVTVSLGRSFSVRDDDWKRVDVTVGGDVAENEDYDEQADAAYEKCEGLIDSYIEKFTGIKVKDEEADREARRKSREGRRHNNGD